MYKKRVSATTRKKNGKAPKWDQPAKESARRKNGCSICKTPGHNAKTCPQRPIAPPVDAFSPSSPGKIPRITFGRIKISQAHDVPAEQIAQQMDLDVAEVETAFEYETFSDYAAS